MLIIRDQLLFGLTLCVWQPKDKQRRDEEMAKRAFFTFSQSAEKVNHNCSALGQPILSHLDAILPKKGKGAIPICAIVMDATKE